MGCQSSVILENSLTFSICTHDPDTKILTDADSVPTFRVYEDVTETAILTGNMDSGTGAADQFDDANTTGFYVKQIDCTAANGFESGKSYNIYIRATVAGDTGGIAFGFTVEDAPALADKLQAYFQLALRSDFGIGTDRSTELSEINNDEGSGAGDYSHTTDANEAIRDHGDQAWLTGSGGGVTSSYTTTDWTRTVGDDDGGVGSDTTTVNGTYFATGEVATGNYIEVDAVFDIGDDEKAETLSVWGFYNGGGQHYIRVQAYNVNDSTYEDVGVMALTSGVQKYNFQLSPNHTNTTTDQVLIKFLHGGGNGVASHVFNIDKAEVDTISTANNAVTWTVQVTVT